MRQPLLIASRVTVGDLQFRVMIDGDALEQGIAAVAGRLTSAYQGRSPLVVCVLNGAAMFHAELVLRMPIPVELDYIRVASYGDRMDSSGSVNFTAEGSTQIEGRNVILVEDIVDTGMTVRKLRSYYRDHGARSVEVAALLYKREADRFGEAPEYFAFEIPNRFVIGFGLDYRQQGRNLPAIYALDDVGNES